MKDALQVLDGREGWLYMGKNRECLDKERWDGQDRQTPLGKLITDGHRPVGLRPSFMATGNTVCISTREDVSPSNISAGKAELGGPLVEETHLPPKDVTPCTQPSSATSATHHLSPAIILHLHWGKLQILFPSVEGDAIWGSSFPGFFLWLYLSQLGFILGPQPLLTRFPQRFSAARGMRVLGRGGGM